MGHLSMTYIQLMDHAVRELTRSGSESPRFDAAQLLQGLCGADRAFLLRQGDCPCPTEQEARVLNALARMAEGEPLQYLLGSWEFYGLEFAVGPGVLIPRPDTETVVDCCRELLQAVPHPTVADLCSGSGAIALALYHRLPDAQVTAVELSREAEPYLRRNIHTLSGDRVALRMGDVLAPVELPVCDLIVSNPPYITAEDMKSLSPQVRREPEMALYGGEDGLTFYRGIAALYQDSLKPGGWLVFEIGYDQGESVPRRSSGRTAMPISSAGGTWLEFPGVPAAGAGKRITTHRAFPAGSITGGKPMKLLVVVDMQKDFVNGALGTSEAEAIVPAVAERIRQAAAMDGKWCSHRTHTEPIISPRKKDRSSRWSTASGAARAGRSSPNCGNSSRAAGCSRSPPSAVPIWPVLFEHWPRKLWNSSGFVRTSVLFPMRCCSNLSAPSSPSRCVRTAVPVSPRKATKTP